MSRASRHRILAAMLSACLLSLLGGCTPLTVLAVLGGCKDGGSNGSSGGVTGSVTTGEVRDGMTIAQAKAWFNGSDGPDNVCQAYPDGQCTWWACMRGHKNGLDVGSYWGNGECFIQRDAGHSELYMTLEAPNHATVTVTVPAEADEKGLRRAMADGLLDFDPDEEFDECWSREFAARNGFTPSGFLSGLQEDKAYFGLRSEALLHPGQSNAGQGNETIAEIRWTEEDLRHWLKDHDWPDNNENMDAMRDMISARELRDRSIEEGWEIIDAMVDDGRLARKDEGEKAETSETYDPANPADPLSIADTSASAAATR